MLCCRTMRSSRQPTKLWRIAIATAAVHGWPGFLAEVVLRLLVRKHVRNWSNAVLQRDVRTATSPASALARCPMPRPWATGGLRSDRP